MQRMAVTLSDLAARLGCNISTISRALRDDPRVSQAMRERVRAVADELGYHANLAARNLATGRTRTVWMLMAHLGFSTDYEPAQAASRFCQQRGYDVHVVIHHGDPDTHARLVRRLGQQRCDGVLIIPHELDATSPQLAELITAGFPLVFIDRYVPTLAAPAFSTDNAGAAAELLRRCAAVGAEVVVNCFTLSNTAEAARAQGLRDAGLPLVEASALAALPTSTVIALVGSGSWAIHRELHAHVAIYTGRQLVIGVFDHWEGEPHPAREVIVCRQDFGRIAELAAGHLLELVAGEARVTQGLTTVPAREFCSVLPRL